MLTWSQTNKAEVMSQDLSVVVSRPPWFVTWSILRKKSKHCKSIHLCHLYLQDVAQVDAGLNQQGPPTCTLGCFVDVVILWFAIIQIHSKWMIPHVLNNHINFNVCVRIFLGSYISFLWQSKETKSFTIWHLVHLKLLTWVDCSDRQQRLWESSHFCQTISETFEQ